MGNNVDTIGDRIQKANFTAIDRVFSPKIELANRSKNAFSGQDATSVMARSERGEHIGITASFENVPQKNNTLNVFFTKDETQIMIPDEVNELSVPGANSDRQPHTRHKWTSKCLFPRRHFIYQKNNVRSIYGQ